MTAPVVQLVATATQKTLLGFAVPVPRPNNLQIIAIQVSDDAAASTSLVNGVTQTGTQWIAAVTQTSNFNGFKFEGIYYSVVPGGVAIAPRVTISGNLASQEFAVNYTEWPGPYPSPLGQKGALATTFQQTTTITANGGNLLISTIDATGTTTDLTPSWLALVTVTAIGNVHADVNPSYLVANGTASFSNVWSTVGPINSNSTLIAVFSIQPPRQTGMGVGGLTG